MSLLAVRIGQMSRACANVLALSSRWGGAGNDENRGSLSESNCK